MCPKSGTMGRRILPAYWRPMVVVLVLVGILFGAASCTMFSAPPLPITQVASPLPTATQVAARVPTASVALPTVVRPISPTPTATASPQPATPTSVAPQPEIAPQAVGCPPPPPGWVAHTVLSSDTIYDLANSTNSTIEQIQAVNCLADPSLIYDGQVIFVPSGTLPLPPDTAVPAPPDTAVPAPSDTAVPAPLDTAVPAPSKTAVPPRPNRTNTPRPAVTNTPTPALPDRPTPGPAPTPCGVFNCPPDGLPDLELAVGGPDDPSFIPCQGHRAQPWVDSHPPYIMQLGLRRYFFACDFPTSPLSATVTLSDGSIQPVQLLGAAPNPDLPQGNAQAVIEWPALPIQPTGTYTLTVASSAESQVAFPFLITAPTQEFILPVPAAGPAGTIFQIYYVNFDFNSTPTFDFYGEDHPVAGGDHVLSHRRRWQISITTPLVGSDGKGWAQAPLESTPADPPAGYAISYDNKRVLNLIWLR